MKKVFILCLICVIFSSIISSTGFVYALSDEKLHFIYNEKVFEYSLNDNIKKSNVFDVDYEINKYNRFGSKEERICLLKRMLSLGFEKSIALDYLFPNLTKKINSIAKNIYIKEKNAQLKIDSNSNQVFYITPEIVGRKLDTLTLIDNICFNYIHGKNLEFNLPTTKINPEITQKYFNKFTNLRSDFATDISNSSADRKHNIKNALMSLNKVEIAPNQIFSFNKIVGRRTAENGYRQAKIIVNNEFVEGIGGGVCQVSTTLYNSALLAGLEILEANKHSKQVGYVKYGFDAMVNFGSSDLKFRNNTSEKITIITNYSQTNARIRIFGENMLNTKYKLTSEIYNVIEPEEETLVDEKQEYLDQVKYEDEFFYFKKGTRGMEIKSYREKYVNNSLVSTEFLRHDKFKVVNTVKIYGSIKKSDSTTPNYSFSLIG